jgi:glycosyltransferase involved in cell wall biosynthesis
MNIPLFSVIMPNYNNSIYIKAAIESVLAQKYTNWELIIVDDGSSDNSIDIINSYLKNKKIKLIKNRSNKGVAYTAMKAVENSSGTIIGTLDSDDILHENALKIMVDEHILNPDAGLIYSNHYVCDENLNILKQLDLIESFSDGTSLQDIFIDQNKSLGISFHFRTFKRFAYDLIDGYDANLLCFEDRDLYYQLEKIAKIKCVNQCLYFYRHIQDIGAYRKNPKEKYYKFICEYKEVKRRFVVSLPFVEKVQFSPFLLNIIYIFLNRYIKGVRKDEFRSFYLKMGHSTLNKNKIMAILYFLNSMLYGFTPIKLSSLKKIVLKRYQ